MNLKDIKISFAYFYSSHSIKVGVKNCTSNNLKFEAFNFASKNIKAIFEALLTAENIDSAKKTLPIEIPYMPPTRNF